VPPPTLERVLKERVAGLVGAELELVEAEIRRELDSPVGLIQEMGGYIAGAGGKRLRPILLLLAARLAGYQGPRSVRLGCVVELLHTATLIHDDVVDQAPLRRGRPSANARWGDDASVLETSVEAWQRVQDVNAFAREGVRVNALCPGPVETPLLLSIYGDDPAALERRRRHWPTGRLAKPREIVNAALFLASDESSYVTGTTFLVDGGLTAAYVTPE